MRLPGWTLVPCLLQSLVAGTILFVELESAEHTDQILDSLKSNNHHCLQSEARLSVRRRLRSSIFHGLSVEIPRTTSAKVSEITKCLQETAGVVATWRAPEYSLASQGDSDSTQPPIDSSVFHELTGVTQAHQQGHVGDGVTIAIIDAGVDYLHPAFGAGVGENYTVTYSVDLTGDDFDIDSTPHPDNDGYTECTYHGTHVTGIAAGNHSAVGFVGVAPGARIEHYRISGCFDTPLQSHIVVDAILRAHSRNVDVISASLTTNRGPYPDDLVAEVLSRIVREDKIVCVIAAGNYGWKGAFSSLAPASTAGVLAVGAVNAREVPNSVPRAVFSVSSDGKPREFAWKIATPSRFPESIPLCTTRRGPEGVNDVCEPPTSNFSGSLSNCVALVRRGGCLFAPKMKNIVAMGGRYTLIYDNSTISNSSASAGNASSVFELFKFDNTFPGIDGAGSISAELGMKMQSLLDNGENITLRMDSNFTMLPYVEVGKNPSTGGMVQARGSWGPTGNLDLMPNILAPGAGIWSTFPRSWGGYGTLSGTSMAAPYVAGAAALVKQAFPDCGASEIVSRLTATARPLPFSDGTPKAYEYLASAWQQGSGLLNVTAAIGSTTTFSATSIPLNDTEHFNADPSFEITNTGDERVYYNFSIVPAVTIATFASADSVSIIPYSLENGSSIASNNFLATLLPDIEVRFDVEPSGLSLLPGDTASVNLKGDPEALQALKENCLLYSGFVEVQSSLGETSSIPFAGLACNMAQVAALPPGWNQTFITGATYRQAEGGSYEATPMKPNTTFSLPRNGSVPSLELSVVYPTVNLALAMFSHNVSITVISSDEKSNATDPVVYAFEDDYRPGGYSRVTTSYFLWDGRLANGSWASEGRYAYEVCAQRTWTAHSDCVRTSTFSIAYIQ